MSTLSVDRTTPADPAPMEGGGGYNRHSAVQASGASPALPLLVQAAHDAPLPPGDATIVVVDYGSSEGRNSLAPMAASIHALRARSGSAHAISVVHTDLPGNDFGSLFQLLATDPASYLRDDPAAFASAIGRSFYEQILPSASVTLGWSAWAVQWLSRIPAAIPDHVQIACSRSEEARQAFARHAAQDWETFLTCRRRELRPGGRLVIVTMACTDEGEFGYRGSCCTGRPSGRLRVGWHRGDPSNHEGCPPCHSRPTLTAGTASPSSAATLWMQAMSTVAAEEVVRILAGQRPRNFINPEAWPAARARRAALGYGLSEETS